MLQGGGASEDRKKRKDEMELRLKLLSEMDEKLKDYGELLEQNLARDRACAHPGCMQLPAVLQKVRTTAVAL